MDVISKGVNTLKEMAIEMGTEVELQGKIMDELDRKVDKTTAHLNNLNKRLKDTLNRVCSL